jgi:hypothetical protein
MKSNLADALDAGLRLCFIRASLARAGDARRSPNAFTSVGNTTLMIKTAS